MNKTELIERLEWHAKHQRDCHRMQHAEGFEQATQVVRNCLDEPRYRYTTNQPDNLNAWRLGKACNEAARDPKCGDYIDRGLILLKALEELGFGISPIE